MMSYELMVVSEKVSVRLSTLNPVIAKVNKSDLVNN